jgi:predicted glutamine amidotransferase
LCLIVSLPKDARADAVALAFNRVERAWWINDDGGGFAYASKARVNIAKPFFDKEKFLAALKRAWGRAQGRSDLLIHLRFATHGEPAARNTHPHALARGRVALAHNGVLAGYGSPIGKKDGVSDTRHYCDYLLSQLTEDELLDPENLALLADDIGSSNRFALLGSDGRTRIVNADTGSTVNGVWFSSADSHYAPTTYRGNPYEWGAPPPLGHWDEAIHGFRVEKPGYQWVEGNYGAGGKGCYQFGRWEKDAEPAESAAPPVPVPSSPGALLPIPAVMEAIHHPTVRARCASVWRASDSDEKRTKVFDFACRFKARETARELAEDEEADARFDQLRAEQRNARRFASTEDDPPTVRAAIEEAVAHASAPYGRQLPLAGIVSDVPPALRLVQVGAPLPPPLPVATEGSAR